MVSPDTEGGLALCSLPCIRVFICLAYWKDWDRRPGSSPQEALAGGGTKLSRGQPEKSPGCGVSPGWRVGLSQPGQGSSGKGGG